MGTNPFALTDKTKDLNDRFYLIMNKIIKSYPSTKLYPNDTANMSVYNDSMARMEKLQNEYFLYKNSIIKASEDIQRDIIDSNDNINALEGQTKILKVQYENLKSSAYSAEGLFDDAQISRNQLLVGNFILFGLMAGGGVIYYKSLKKA
jgi:hypothetical protein